MYVYNASAECTVVLRMIPGHLSWANETTLDFFPLHIHTYLIPLYNLLTPPLKQPNNIPLQYPLLFSPLMSIRPSDDLQADIAELESLIAMTTRPNILQTLEKLRNSLHEQQQQNMSPSIRTPIQRSKAKAHTVYITTGYGWCQTKETVIIYLTVKNAFKLSPGQYTMDVQRRSIQLDIMEHEGANYNFRISQLNGQVIPEKTKIKLKDSKLIIYLYKENHGREWNDIRLKTTRDVYDELQRAEGKGATPPPPTPMTNMDLYCMG
ncbi:predicted protein [Lichtheimia corymbifera JMRC:FSU:9682]|uniref:CS domain-containing protein n=1 Tax=Lichtheimia corymbifera JMRC:FSU:9682 TaxID=1263082 RepID=A0A068S2B9_9FUNG|nr:predicted protein [Lichtheimia corymbifera JMRC:FSU:9682]